MPLHMIRSIVESVSEYCYDLKTDVWVFADREGFGALIADMQLALTADAPIHVAAIPPDSAGMRCAIMPALKHPAHQALLRVLERVVFWRELPTMQVVLCGNDRGYARLVRLMRRAMLSTGGPLDHWHLDDACDQWVAKRSISLNLRGAVQEWGSEELADYDDDLRSGGDYRLPANIQWLNQDAEHLYDYFPSDMCKHAIGDGQDRQGRHRRRQ